MHIVMVSKALVVGAYQSKLEALARQPDVKLTAIVPSAWRDRRGKVKLERAHTNGYEMLVAPLVFNGQYHLHFYPTLGRLLHRLRPDILHMDEEPYNLATWLALRAGDSVGARGLFFTWQNLGRRYPWPFRRFERENYRRAAYAIAGNASAGEVLRSKGYCGPMAVVPQFGVDPDVYCPPDPTTAPAAEGPFATRPVIGYAGALIPEKGVDMLLRACAGLPRGAWSLVLIGDGPQRSALAALAESLGIAGQVHFLGRLPSTEMAATYSRLDVLVLPSLSRPNWTEQFGRVLVEAMACQVAVVGSNCGEIPYVIGDAGLVVPEGDVVTLREALAGLIANPERRAELGRQGRERVLDHFAQSRVAEATYQVYCDILGR